MSTPAPIDPPLGGFPEGTSFEWIPATCPVPDFYVTPTCSRGHWVISIPDFRELAESGSQVFTTTLTFGVVFAVVGALLVLAHVLWVTRHRVHTSLDCRGGCHAACASTGGCSGCACHGADR